MVVDRAIGRMTRRRKNTGVRGVGRENEITIATNVVTDPSQHLTDGSTIVSITKMSKSTTLKIGTRQTDLMRLLKRGVSAALLNG